MPIMPHVGRRDQSNLEARIADIRFVPRNQEDGLPLMIEREGGPPRRSIGIASELLHVRALRIFLGIHNEENLEAYEQVFQPM